MKKGIGFAIAAVLLLTGWQGTQPAPQPSFEGAAIAYGARRPFNWYYPYPYQYYYPRPRVGEDYYYRDGCYWIIQDGRYIYRCR